MTRNQTPPLRNARLALQLRPSWPRLREMLKRLVLVVVLFVTSAVATRLSAQEDASEFFEKRVRPVLAGTCFRCHGDRQVAGSLHIDSRESLLKGGDSGAALVPGKPDESLLMKAVRREDDDVSAMPPDKPLRKDEIEALATWIKSGAPWPAKVARFESSRHWAFEPVRDVVPPAVRDERWKQSSVDAFLLARLEAANQRPAPPADRRTLLRRATYDLTGLPPTPADQIAFEADARPTPEAFVAVVERLLSSSHYGEQWGRHWLDVVRYADTAGENSDHPLPHAWRYRNWVIDAFNRDLPYDEFLRQQLAGDLLAARGPADQFASQTIATGYLAIARRFGHDIDKDMHLTYEDVIDNLGKTVLGLTMGCCRCHDHKYDPLTRRDYYGLYGVFESTKFSFPGCEPKQQPRDLIPLMPEAEVATLKKSWADRVAALEAEAKNPASAEQKLIQQIRQVVAGQPRLLAAADVADAGAANLADGQRESLDAITVRAGEVLQLTVLPQTNHGADSTRVEWEIAEVQGERRWSLADLVTNLGRGNPHPGAAVASAEKTTDAKASDGNNAERPVWCFLDLVDGPQLLSEKLDAIDGRSELKAWRHGDTPSVFVNTAEQPVKVWTELPPRSFFVHPGPKGPVAVAWVAPSDVVVRVKGRVADAHPGGDGVAFRLEHFAHPELATLYAEMGRAVKQRMEAERRLRDEIGPEPTIPVAYAVTDAKAKNARLQKRGDPEDLGDEVPRRFLGLLGGASLDTPAASGRLELAERLTAPDNPLTARVMVNRIWLGHFGRGLVATPNDFGTRGAPPTDPELLDHLATQFMRGGWSVKKMHRLIMSSAAYQQASGNRTQGDTYSAFARRRLTAEELRDTLLVLSGELDPAPGGAHPFPPEKSWSFSQHAPFAAEYDTLKRSVYTMQKRNRRIRFFALFDGADPNASTPVRDLTTVPTQALFFMNDPFVHERAAKFAGRIVSASSDVRGRLDFAFQQMLGRPASAAELADFATFETEYSPTLAPVPAAQRDTALWQAYARVLLASNELIYLD